MPSRRYTSSPRGSCGRLWHSSARAQWERIVSAASAQLSSPASSFETGVGGASDASNTPSQNSARRRPRRIDPARKCRDRSGRYTALPKPRKRERPESSDDEPERARDGEGHTLVDLNTATSEELQQLPQIGAPRSEYIIAARPFTAVSDLSRVQSFGEALLTKIKDGLWQRAGFDVFCSFTPQAHGAGHSTAPTPAIHEILSRLQKMEAENKQLQGEVRHLKGQVHALQQRRQADDATQRDSRRRQHKAQCPDTLQQLVRKVSNITVDWKKNTQQPVPYAARAARKILWHAGMTWKRLQDKLHFLRRKAHDWIRGHGVFHAHHDRSHHHPSLGCQSLGDPFCGPIVRSAQLLESIKVETVEWTQYRCDVPGVWSPPETTFVRDFLWDGPCVGPPDRLVRLMRANDKRRVTVNFEVPEDWFFCDEVSRQYHNIKSQYIGWLRWQALTAYRLMKKDRAARKPEDEAEVYANIWDLGSDSEVEV